MKNKLISCYVFGLNESGVSLARELARFSSLHKNMSIILCDDKAVSGMDISGSLYLPEDIGMNRAAITAMVLNDSFELWDDNPILSCVMPCSERDLLNKLSGYVEDQDRSLFFFDCTDSAQCGLITSKFIKKYNFECTVMQLENGVYTKSTYFDSRSTVHDMCKRESRKISHEYDESVLQAVIMFANFCRITQHHKPEEFISTEATADGYLPIENRKFHILLFGAGGTGGDFAKMILPILRKEEICITIIDGDRVEKKNLERQAFLSEDIQRNKAVSLREKIIKSYPSLVDRVHCIDHYIDSADQLRDIPILGLPILVGAVDNHRARQVADKYIREKNGIWIDSANEYSYGEVVTGIVHRNRIISPLRSDIFPEVLTDTGKRASEESCGAVNLSSPQHQATNLMAAAICTRICEDIICRQKVKGGIDYFSALDEKLYIDTSPLYTKEVGYIA